MNYSLFHEIQGLHGNGFFDAVMEFVAQYLLVGVFAVLGLLLLARLRTDGFGRAVRDALWPGGALVLSYVLGDWCESAGVVTLALEGGAESR